MEEAYASPEGGSADQTFEAPLKSWDKVARDNQYPNGIPTDQCSDHGDVDLCSDYNYKIYKQGHGTYDATGDALDIGGAANEELYAVHDGKVISIRGDAHTAMLVEIEGKVGDKKIRTLYAHINVDSSLSEGSTVSKGQKIGTLSATYPIPHVHFEMEYDGKYIKAGDIPSYME